MPKIFGEIFSSMNAHESNGLITTQYSDGKINIWLTESIESAILDKTFDNDLIKYRILYSKFIQGKFIVICTKEEVDSIKERITRRDLYLATIQDILDLEPKTLNDHLIHLMEVIKKQADDFGKDIDSFDLRQLYMRDRSEIEFFMKYAKDLSYITYIDVSTGANKSYRSVKILPNGWVFIGKMEIGIEKRNQIFIAMWFNTTMDRAQEVISESIRELGFSPMRIDNKEHNNDVSSEILYEIRNSKCIIADVTGQRSGVYFESGYALGLKIPVIWSCREDDMKNIHFDTRQYNHVIWKNEEDLKERLKKRIRSTLL